MRHALHIASKDLRRSLRDRSALMVSIVAPLGLAFILSTVLGGATEDVNFDFAIVDDDGGPVAQAFVDGAVAQLQEAGVVTIVEAESEQAARDLAVDGEVAAAFVLPQGTSDAFTRGAATEIRVITDPEAEIGGQVATSIAEGFAAELDAVQLSLGSVFLGGGRPDPAELARLQREARAVPPPARVVASRRESREFDDKTFFAAGMAVFFLFFTTGFGAIGLLRERREGTLARLLAAPVSKGSIVGGKALYTFTLGVLSMATLLLASKFLLGARWGNPVAVAVVVVAGVLAALGLQSLVMTLAKTDEQAIGYGSIVGVTLGLLGGTFFPLSQSGFLAGLSYLTPHAWLMRALGDLSGGASGLADVVGPIAILAGMGAVTGAVAFVRARSLVVTR